jgi:hypothetical protein
MCNSAGPRPPSILLGHGNFYRLPPPSSATQFNLGIVNNSGFWGCFLGVRWPEREVDHSCPFSAELKNEWSYTYTATSPYVSVACRGTAMPLLRTSIRHMSGHLRPGELVYTINCHSTGSIQLRFADPSRRPMSVPSTFPAQNCLS